MHTFADPLRHACRTAGDRLATVCGVHRHSYFELERRCRRLVSALRGLGAEPGDRIAVLSANCHRYIESYLAIPAGGFVLVPLNTRHATPELRYALEDAGAKILLTDRDSSDVAGSVDRVVQMPDEYEALLADASEEDFPVVSEDDLAGLFYTGGTTGASKGVMLTHRNLLANTYHWQMSSPQRVGDVYMVMAPLFHAAGSNSVLATTWTGGTQLPLAAFDPEAALDMIEAEGVTVTLGVPTMLAAIAEAQHAKPRKVSTLRLIGHGGSPIATEILRRCHAAFPNASLCEVYGATELSPIATLLQNEESLMDHERARSCGQAAPGVEIRCVSPEGESLPDGEVGEVIVRGPHVMRGYWNKPEQTAAALRDGWYWTGDLGYFDAEGYLFLVDRSKDMIVSGGENVYSTEVEEVLYRHPAVLEAAVFGVPDEKWGEAVWAVVVPRTEVTPDALIEFCREHVGGYKVPKGIDLREEPLPKSGPGKVLKRELRAPFWEGRDRGIH